MSSQIEMLQGYNPRGPLDLILLPQDEQKNKKVEDLV